LKQSKLHFVDLAGSERVENLDGQEQRLQEARNINQSLYFLHRVIDALKENSQYVPYRSSKMTMLLKDSLGGNCLTTMIAAISSHMDHMHESISTCKFALDVMSIENTAKANISIDPNVLISQLRAEVVRLKHELAIAQGEEQEEPVTPEESERLVLCLKAFLSGREPMPPMSPSRVSFCFDWLRINGVAPSDDQGDGSGVPSQSPPRMGDPELRKAMNKLAKKLQTREVEIGVLVNMLNQRKNRAVAWTQTSTAAGGESQRIELPKLDKKQAFQEFVRNHRKYAVVEANNATMREKIQQAKELGDAAQALKAKIGNTKQELQQKADDGADDDALADLGAQIAQDTDRYMKMCADMRTLKKEVETITAMTTQATKQVKRDFANFWMSHQSQQDDGPPSGRASRPPEDRNADPCGEPPVLRLGASGSDGTGRRSARRSSGGSDADARAVRDIRASGGGRLAESPSGGERPELKLTGDPLADEKIRKFAESRAAFLKKAEEARRSQSGA
jgi:kinesin family protein 6/9